jgi:DNA-binding response OmpR family regulator
MIYVTYTSRNDISTMNLDAQKVLRAYPRHGGVPVAFYSRKISPEDVVRVLKAGAVDAIRKGSHPKSKSCSG